MNINFEEFNRIIEETKRFNNNDDKTFFEITKYPYREQVASNILAFYFDVKEKHEFKDMFLKVFLKTIVNKEKNTVCLIDLNEEIQNLEVKQEYKTKKDNRIDIVMFNEDFAIGIENKLDANLYNDLYDYAKTIDSINKRNYKVVLSIKEENVNNGFINIQYKDFFENLIIELKNKEKSKWTIFLEEFIETIRRKEIMKAEFINWYEKNQRDVDNMLTNFIKIHELANEEVRKLNEKLKEAIEKYNLKPGNSNANQQINQDFCSSISNVKLKDGKYVIDNRYNLVKDVWEVQLYSANKQNLDEIKKVLKDNGISDENIDFCDKEKHHIKICEYPNSSEYKEVIKKNIEIIEFLNENNK